MTNASVISPFSLLTDETPWIVWQQETDMLSLLEKEQTERLNSTEENRLMVGKGAPVLPSPAIQRRQYNAVLNRLHQASQHAGNFSSWKNT